MTDSGDEVLPVSDLEPPARSATPRILAVVVVVLLVAAVVTAVLLRDGERSPAERFAAIPAAVSEEPFAFEMTMGGPFPLAAGSAPRDLEITMSGAADPASRRTRAELDMSSVIPAGLGMPATLTMVTDDQVAYVQLPTPGGTAGRWQKVDASALTSGATGGLPSSTNPLDSFEQLRSVDADIEDLGEEEVRGTRTTHFRTRLDMEKVLATLPAERRPKPGSQEAELFSSMADVPVDVWLDDEDRPRRQRMTFSIPADAASGRAALDLTMQIETFDFGKAVTIDLPPADQVDDNGFFGGS